MKKFYVLEEADKPDAVRLDSPGEYDTVSLFAGKYRPTEPFRVELSEGKVFYDVVRFQDVPNFAISQRLFDLLKENKITGWRSYELQIMGVEQKFYGFQVIGTSGELDHPKVAGFYSGLKITEDSWDKSDLFRPRGTTMLICTERVRRLCKMHKITNLEFEDANTFSLYSFGVDD